jgi:hypothetical protein
VIDTCDNPKRLWAFWQAVEKVSVLDPTCGSGAFLFAALNVLEPLYDACLDRMQDLCDDPRGPGHLADFRQVLDQIGKHPSRRYFVLKSIIIQNLYGVDLMKEAVEICKLRLFLKLVAQVQRVDQLEPLPDIDFNIRAGNTLVGFANQAHPRRDRPRAGKALRLHRRGTGLHPQLRHQVPHGPGRGRRGLIPNRGDLFPLPPPGGVCGGAETNFPKAQTANDLRKKNSFPPRQPGRKRITAIRYNFLLGPAPARFLGRGRARRCLRWNRLLGRTCRPHFSCRVGPDSGDG